MPRSGQIAPSTGPMNQDFDFKVVNTGKGEVFERVNLRPSNIVGRHGNRKVKGNTRIYLELPAGTNKEIGWIKNMQEEAFLYFIYNSNGNHCVCRYKVSGSLEKVWYAESSLDLENANLRGFVAEGDVYWINGSKPPKSFNILKAINYTNGTSGDSYTAADQPFGDNIFPWINRPPRFAPAVAYNNASYDGANPIQFNNLRGKQWQFKYNYKYKNNQESAYSAISKVPLPNGEIKVGGEWSDDLLINNAIDININTGGSDVKEINIAVMDASNINTGSFYVFHTLKKYDDNDLQIIDDDTDYVVQFLNNSPLSNIDTDVNNRYFDNVPLSGKDAILLDGKYGTIAMPEEGYDGVTPDYDYSLQYEEIDFEVNTIQLEKRTKRDYIDFQIYYVCNTKIKREFTVTYIIPDVFYPESVYQISVERPNSANKNVNAVYITGTSAPADFRETIRQSLVNQLKAQITSCDEPYLYIDQYFFTGIDVDGAINLTFSTVDGYADDTTSGIITTGVFSDSYKTLKRGQYHPFAIVYNDGFGRYNVAEYDKELFVPNYDGTEEDFSKTVKPRITINHLPPDWAKTYRIAYVRNKSYTYFLYVPVVEQLGDSEEGVPSGFAFLKINQATQRIREAFPHSEIADYVWQEGDRVKVPGSDKDYQITKEYIRNYTDGADAVTETGYLIADEFDVIAGTDKVALIQIYRPNLSPQDSVFTETGDEFEILNPGTAQAVHAGNVQNQTAALPAIIDLDFGDVYLRQRLSGDTDSAVAIVEDMNFLDYYQSTGIDAGRIAVDIFMQNEIWNRVIRSENYIEDTEINRLNVFLPGTAVFDVSDTYGNITVVAEVGDVMKVIQAHKETSVYVGKINVKEAQGQEIIILSDDVFGGFRRYIEDIGTIHQKSAKVAERYLYYFDLSTGDFIRSAANGQASISKEYNMQSWFESKAKEMRETSEFTDVITGINMDHSEVLVTFIVGQVCETIVFSEDDNNKGWMYFLHTTESPEDYADYGDAMFVFKDGQLWTHNTGAPNNFFGKTESCLLKFVCNGDPVDEKRLTNIEINSDKNIWNVEITSDEGANYGAQKTILTPAIMSTIGNRIVSDVLCNIIGRDGVENLQLLYNGHDMIGDHFLVKLSNDDGEEIYLNETILKYKIST